MAHFAKVVDGIVEQVIVAEQDFINTQEGTWVQTSYNTHGGQHFSFRFEDVEESDADGNTVTSSLEVSYPDGGEGLRKNYAAVGDTYDSVRDAFIAPQPFPSWTLNEDTCWWNAPVAYPTDGNFYQWDEDTISWVELND